MGLDVKEAKAECLAVGGPMLKLLSSFNLTLYTLP